MSVFANQVTEQKDVGIDFEGSALLSIPERESAVCLIGVAFCHYHRVIVSAQQMLP